MKEIKTEVGNESVRLKINVIGWVVMACLFADDTVLFVESEEELQSEMD